MVRGAEMMSNSVWHDYTITNTKKILFNHKNIEKLTQKHLPEAALSSGLAMRSHRSQSSSTISDNVQLINITTYIKNITWSPNNL